ncbi:MAG TPA: MFS transporter [Terriglobales bacterium]|jgi:MFS family permease
MQPREQVASDAGRRNVFAFGLTSLFNDVATEMAYWVLPAFLVSIGAGPAQLGVIEGIAESVASFVQLFAGYLTDRISRRKPIVVGGYFVANAVKPLLALVTSWGQVLAIRFADRFSKGIRSVPRDVMVAESTQKLGSAYGLIQSLDSAGAVLGPLIALVLLPLYGLRLVFLAAAVPGFLCVAAALFGIREVKKPAALPPQTATQGTKETGTKFSLFSLPRAFYFLVFIVTLFSLGNSSDMFLVLRAGNIGIPATRAPLLGLIFNVTYTLFSWPAGILSDRLSPRSIAASGYLVFAAVYFVFGLAPSQLAIWIAMGSYGLFYALTNPVLKSLVVASVPKEIRGRALGIYAFVTSSAILLASILTGELWKYFGARLPFFLSAALALTSAALLILSGIKPMRSKPALDGSGTTRITQ